MTQVHFLQNWNRLTDFVFFFRILKIFYIMFLYTYKMMYKHSLNKYPTQTLKTNLWVTKGEGRDEYIESLGLTYI